MCPIFKHLTTHLVCVGLAYVAKENSRGGICQNELNTGIVTTLNYGRRVAPQVTVLTFAHEVGHNFGSEVSVTVITPQVTLINAKLNFQ